MRDNNEDGKTGSQAKGSSENERNEAPRENATPNDRAGKQGDQQGSTASRPRGKTEDPDRTL